MALSTLATQRLSGKSALRAPVSRQRVVVTKAALQLKPPPYALDALEPHMSKSTLEVHWGKHHQAYVTNLNGQIAGTDLDSKTLEEIVVASWNGGKPTAQFNNAAQVWNPPILCQPCALKHDVGIRDHAVDRLLAYTSVIISWSIVYVQVWNHTFFWESMGPNKGGEPTGALAEAIKRDFGSFEDFKTQFKTAGATQFGSGWAWLNSDKAGKLSITKTPNAENPVVYGQTPILTVDVWEHAYVPPPFCWWCARVESVHVSVQVLHRRAEPPPGLPHHLRGEAD
jgi:superoxide dismutase, Fe-Mn family